MNEKKKLLIVLIIIGGMFLLIITSAIISQINSNKVYKQFEETFKSDITKIIYLGRPTCGYCQIFKPMLDELATTYEIDYLYINTDKINNGTLNKILKNLDVNRDDFGTPYTVIVKAEKVIDVQDGIVSEESELFAFLQKNSFIDEKEEYKRNTSLNYINIDEYLNLVKSPNRSAIVIGQTTCSHCIAVRPILSDIVDDEGVVINYIDYNTLSEEAQVKLNNSLDYLKNTNWGTPILLIVENNALIDYYSGQTTKEIYTKFLKDNGVIK